MAVNVHGVTPYSMGEQFLQMEGMGYSDMLVIVCQTIWHLIGEEHYILTSWSRVLLEQLTGFQLVKKFSAFYGTQSQRKINSQCIIFLHAANWYIASSLLSLNEPCWIQP